jgi:membrane protein YqaA with SNARE-associated domain
MKNLLQAFIAWGAPGLLLAAILDGAGLPIPGGVDALLVFLAGQRQGDAWWLALVAVAGSAIGNLLLFWLAKRGGEKFLHKRSQGRAARFRRWFEHYGLATVFTAALVPLPIMPMKIFVVCAGAMGSRVGSFLLTFTAARLMRYFGLAYLGRRMGPGALGFVRANVWWFIAFAVVVFAVLLILGRLADRHTSNGRSVNSA